MNKAETFAHSLGLNRTEATRLGRLRNPAQIQDFIEAIPINHEVGGETCLSVQQVLRQRRAHCLEAAFVAACALWIQGEPPLIINMRAHGDDDHAVVIFERNGCLGAISKSNHIWLRWRDPVYRNMRELMMSYFHEYTNHGVKRLAAYSTIFDLRRVDPALWVTNAESCWSVARSLADQRHYPLLKPGQRRLIKPRDRFEQKADNFIQYPAKAENLRK